MRETQNAADYVYQFYYILKSYDFSNNSKISIFFESEA